MGHFTPDDWMDFTWWDHAHKRHVRIRRPLLGRPASCVTSGNPRIQRAVVALPPCGHVSTGAMDLYDVQAKAVLDAWLAPR